MERTESQLFEKNPLAYAERRLLPHYDDDGDARAPADYVLTFDCYERVLRPLLSQNYEQVKMICLCVQHHVHCFDSECLHQIAVVPHAHFRYDYDDPLAKNEVLVFARKQIDISPSLP